MVEVNICSLRRLIDVVNYWKPDKVISAIPTTLNPDKALMVPINDIYNIQLVAYKNAIREVLACDAERILIHCEHGQSRSAALAIARLYQEDPYLVDKFLAEHPEAEPNALLLLLADEILGADFDLLRRCVNRYKGCKL